MKLKDLIGKKIAIHCKTKEEAKRLLKALHDLGGEWLTGHSLILDSFYNVYKDATCYVLEEIDNLVYEEIEYLMWLEDYKIIEFTDLKLGGNVKCMN